MAKKAFSITLRGTLIDGAKIGNFKKSLNSVDDNLTNFANAAAAQYSIGNNRNWLDDLFTMKELRNVNGKLSVKGKEVASYLRAFTPISITEKDGKVEITLNAKNKGVFYSLEKDDNGSKVKIDALENPEFPMTLREFTNRDKPKKSGATDKKASTISKQLETLAELLNGEKDAKVTGSYAEMTALAEMADRLHQAAVSAKLKADDKKQADIQSVEQSYAQQSNNVSGPAEARADTDREEHAKKTA